MDSAQDPLVIGLRFSKVGKVYHFDAANLSQVRQGDSVVVETSRGWQIGEVAQVVQNPGQPPEGGWKLVSRLASPRDLLLRQVWQLREYDVVETCKKRAAEIRVQNIKVVSAEYSFDGARLTILYSSEGEEKVDLKSLRQDMQRTFTPAQVDLRQIGPRDVAKIIGGMGACGLESRCCSKFLTDFSSISIRMAKEQGISLTPTEITGMCGRLRCCLIYEYENYAEARKGLPKRGKRLATPAGEGKVIDVQPIQGIVKVDIPEIGVREFTREEIRTFYQRPEGVPDPRANKSETEEDVSPAVEANGQDTPETTNETSPNNDPDSASKSGQQQYNNRYGRKRRGTRRT